MQVFLNEFYKNPSGSGASFLNIKSTQEGFDKRYETVKDKIKCSSCMIKGKSKVYAHILIPSSVDAINYDVILGFDLPRNNPEGTVDKAPMTMFSNSPSFIYTFSYAYNKHGIFAKEFKGKLSAKMLTDAAKAKNAYSVVSYDFSIYASLKYVIEHKLNYLAYLEGIKTTTAFSDLYREVMDAEKLASKRADKLSKDKEAAKREKEVASGKMTKETTTGKSNKFSTAVKKSTVVKTVKKTKII